MPSNSHRTVLSPTPTTQLTLPLPDPLHSLSSSITSLTSSPPNLIYATTSPPSPSLILLTLSLTSPTTLTLVRHVTTPHPIISLHVAPHLNTLIILSSDGYIYLVDSLLEHPLRKLTSLKPVTAIQPHTIYSNNDNAIYSNNGNVGVFGGKKRREFSKSCIVAAVAGGGKRVVFIEVGAKGEGGEVVGVVIREVGLREGVVVKELAWVDDECLVLGTRGGYSLMECGSGEVREIFLVPGGGTGGKGVKVLERSKEVMLMVDNVGIVVDGKGQPVGGSLVFKGEGGGGSVEGVGEMGGYVVCVGGGKLELYYKKSGVCVQRLGFGGGESGGVGPCVLGGGEDGSEEFVVVAAASKVMTILI